MLAVAGVVAYLIWPRQSGLAVWSTDVQACVAILAGVTTLRSGALVASRFLLWDSARGARAFEQTQANPLGEVARHFRWLLGRADKPVVYFIDDLDRCEQGKVMDLLEAIQTLVRGMDQDRGPRPARAAHFIIAADGCWLRHSFEAGYAEFSDSITEPGRSLGYLFLDKLFQLTIRIPEPVGTTRAAYLDSMLGIEHASASPTPGPSGASSPHPSARSATTASERASLQEIRARLARFADGRDQYAATALSQPANPATQHVLGKFAPLLGGNPRTFKKFVNCFSILRLMRILEENYVDNESLALWAIVLVRWPSLAEYIEGRPDAAKGVIDPLWRPKYFDPLLRDLVGSEAVQRVFLAKDGGPLSPEMIRRCVGERVE
jgi:hypothetical protein